MRMITLASSLALAVAVSGTLPGPAGSTLAQSPRSVSSVAGKWAGPFLGTNFVFELEQTADGWSGRYMSDKSGKWAPLQDISVEDGVIRFSFESQPPSSFAMKLDQGRNALTGMATFGPNPPLPLTLNRAS